MMETVLYSDCVIMAHGESKLGITKPITPREVGFNCPRCGRLNPNLSHSHSIQCACGLYMTRFGNSLECSDERPKK